MHSLLRVVAGKIATDNWMEMGARYQCDANAALISRFHREWGIGNARGRAHALLALHRDVFGGGGSGVFKSQRCYRCATTATSAARACLRPYGTAAPCRCFARSVLQSQYSPLTLPPPL